MKLKSKKDQYRTELERIMKQNQEKRINEHVGITKEEITINRKLVESMLTNDP